MTHILEHQSLEINHLLAYRGEITNQEMLEIEKKMEQVMKKAGAKRKGCTIKEVYRSCDHHNRFDVELLIPIDEKIEDAGEFYYREQIRIGNAVVGKHTGNITTIDQTISALRDYVAENNFRMTTVAYQFVKNIDVCDLDHCEIDIYVGIR